MKACSHINPLRLRPLTYSFWTRSGFLNRDGAAVMQCSVWVIDGAVAHLPNFHHWRDTLEVCCEFCTEVWPCFLMSTEHPMPAHLKHSLVIQAKQNVFQHYINFSSILSYFSDSVYRWEHSARYWLLLGRKMHCSSYEYHLMIISTYQKLNFEGTFRANFICCAYSRPKNISWKYLS